MKKIGHIVLIATVILIANLVVAVIAFTEDIPDAEALKLRKIKTPKDLHELSRIEKMILLDNGTAIGFGQAKENESGPFSLYSFKLSRTGKITSANKISDISEIWKCEPFWIGNDKSVMGTAVTGKGLLFFPKAVEDGVVLSRAEFDSDGRIVGEFETVFEYKTKSGFNFDYLYMSSAVGPSSIALAMGFTLEPLVFPGQGGSESFVLEFDFDGNLLGEAKQFPLPDNGDNVSCRVGKPGWNGVDWLVPAGLGDMDRRRTEVYVFATGSYASPATPADTGIKARRILKGTKINLVQALESCLQFLPSSLNDATEARHAASKGQILKLLVQRYSEIPLKKRETLTRNFSYLLLSIKWNGKKEGKGKEISFAPWSPQLKYTDALGVNRESISYLAGLADGRFSIAIARSAVGIKTGSAPAGIENYDYVNDVCLFTFDPDAGTAEKVAASWLDADALVSDLAPPVLQVYKKSMKLVTAFSFFPEGVGYNFFANFTP